MALGVAGVALWAFLWAVRTGQFDGLEGPAYRILMDDDDPRLPPQRPNENSDKSLNE